jgi:fructan beta-fructosidase
MKKIISLLITLSLFFSVSAQKRNDSLYKEKYRPQFHFSPAKNWTNDPNGLVYYKGEYHLFYQYNPYANVWGHMSWAHATSKDLVHWKHLPLAIPEDSIVMIFSGSCVIDENNTSGFAKNSSQTPMVAIYTGHRIPDKKDPDDYSQAQCLAYSLDDGKTWTKYENNPVLDLHKKDFRDPFVFWYEPEKKWVMTVVLPHEHIVQFYSSKNLKDWDHLSDFGPAGDTTAIWECPSITKVPIENGSGQTKWVLLNSQQISMQYFVGEFDGRTFINENPPQKIYHPDHGPDYYAAVVYNHLPADRSPILLGWANNWEYANSIPTSPWKSAMSLPRELSLEKNNDAWILKQKPLAALASLKKEIWEGKNISVKEKKLLPISGTQVEIKLSWVPAEKSISGIHLAVGEKDPFVIGYDAENKKLFINRKGTGDTSFNKNFAALSHYETSLDLKNKKISLDIFFDNSIIEIFAEDGTCVMTAQIFPSKKSNGIELFSENGTNSFEEIKIWQIRSAW